MAGKGSRWVLVVAVGVVLLLVSGAIWYGTHGLQGNTKPLSPEEAREFIHIKNVGLGELENQKVSEAIQSFEPLRKRLARDPLPARNIAAARVVALGESVDKPAQKLSPEMFAAAKMALEELKSVEGDTVAWHWLALHAAMMEGNRDGALTHVQAILTATPKDATGWYAKYLIYGLDFPKQIDPQAMEAIEEACRLNPENAWYRKEWLEVMYTHLNEQPPPKINVEHFREQLQATARSIAPFAHLISVLNNGLDVEKLYHDAEQGIDGGNLEKAGRALFFVKNVMAPHANPDIREARRHPLEFILDDFPPAFYEDAHLSQAAEDSPIPVTFKTLDWSATDAESTEPVSAAVDLAVVDFDLDGLQDIVVLGEKSVVVWSRAGPQAPWRPIVQAAAEGFTHLLAQDLDADFDEVRIALGQIGTAPAALPQNVCATADVDLVLYGPAGVRLLENRFDRKTKQRSLVAIADEKLPGILNRVTAASASDLEADGDLDLVFATADGLKLWSCIGDWRFVDITARSVLPDAALPIDQLLPLDWDRDVDIDILIASPQGAGCLENVRHGQFRWRPFQGDLASLKSARALEAIDADANATWDIVAATEEGLQIVTTANPESGVVRVKELSFVSQDARAGMLSWDYDNDGHEDLLTWSDKTVELWRGGAKFVLAESQLKTGSLTHALAGDLDNDGDQDLIVLGDHGLSLWENVGGESNHWIDVALEAQQNKSGELSASGRVSPYGNGSLLELKSGLRYQTKIVRGQATHFGLGKSQQADVVRVVWVNGIPQNILKPAPDTFLREQQLLIGSCPYLFAFDGEKFVFCTDLLWNAPLGLQYAENVIAQPREWEYLKISGEQLAAKEGHYQLRLTEELWEAAYFDQVRLIAVDHPADVEIYSNEKVGPAEIAEYKIHTVKQPRKIRSAKNHNGRDLLEDLEDQDGVYAAVHDKKLRQGVVEDGYLELDLGDVQDAKQVSLFLTGWIYPSSTAINVALSQGGPLPPGKPPAVWTPDGMGGWKEVLPFMGFPGGKTKTIAVDLSGKLTPGDGRLRIATSMEFYWDHVFFTVDEPPAEVRTQELKLVAADLHYRGFSRIEHDRNNGPEHFIYDDCSKSPKWPPMAGSFTRYGDVMPLLSERDDRLVVMGAGDEATLKFAVPSNDPPPGWKRDFLIYNVGWDKDCNLLTVLGETAEPSPFAAMTSYPWKADETPPQTSEAGGRTQAPTFWRSVLRFGAGTR
jgi:hypothetical protein